MRACSPGSTRSDNAEERRQETTQNRHLAAFLHIIDTSRLLDVLRADNRAIFRAASQASKAADYLLRFDTQADAGAGQ
jgi:antirestriction protein ArdC